MKKEFLLICGVVVISLIVSACSSSDSQPARTKAVQIGALEGDLADNATRQFDLTSNSENSRAPLIIGKTTWDDALKAAIKKVFDDGRPIALINATAGEINILRRIVGFSGDFVLPDIFSYADCYAVDKDIHGDIYDIVIYPDAASEATTETYSMDTANEIATLAETLDFLTDPIRTELFQQQQVRDLDDWLAKDAGRDEVAEAADSAVQLSAGQLTGATTLGSYDLASVAKATETTYVFPHFTNRHQVRNIVWSVHDVNRNEDIFYVRQEGTFAAAQEVYVDMYQHRAFYATRYTLWNSVEPALSDNSKVQLLDSKPPTYEGKVSVDGGVDYKIDGKFGFDGKLEEKGASGGGEVGVAGSLAIKNSVKFDIPDAVVTNKSGYRLNDAAWDYDIRRPYYVWNPLCVFIGLGDIPKLGKGTFLPRMEWIWRVSSAFRAANPDGLPILTEFYAETGRSLLPASGLLNPTACWAVLENRGTKGLHGRMTVKWPPIVAPL